MFAASGPVREADPLGGRPASGSAILARPGRGSCPRDPRRHSSGASSRRRARPRVRAAGPPAAAPRGPGARCPARWRHRAGSRPDRLRVPADRRRRSDRRSALSALTLDHDARSRARSTSANSTASTWLSCAFIRRRLRASSNTYSGLGPLGPQAVRIWRAISSIGAAPR